MTRTLSVPRLFLTLPLLFMVTLAAAADTIRLKNGRVVKGNVERYSNSEFVVRLESGDRMILLVDNVESVEFDSTSAPAPAPSAGGSAPGGAAAYETPVVVGTAREVTATGVQVRRGDPVRITASGEIRFADGRRSGPAGAREIESWPFPGEPFGMLVAMVGSPTSPTYEPIGESKQFTAASDGEVFLQVNARSLEGATGSYNARISVGSSGSAGGTSTPATPAPQPPPMHTESRQLRYDLEVSSTTEWVDTGIDVITGDTLRITAEGTINYTASKTCGPDGGKREWQDLIRELPVNDAGRGTLVGIIGDGSVAKAFLVGAKYEGGVRSTGRLFLGVNDDDYKNNKGSFRARVEIVPERR
ncbi:MAG TPA: hypothetical protein VGA39_01445 [Candidatus Acidoferrales bacterium]